MQSFSFQSDLANMLFDTPADPMRDRFEAALVERFRSTAEGMTSRQLFRNGPKIDAFLLPRLSGRNFLTVAKLIELRAPSALENMPRLRAARAHAARATELSQILSPVALERVLDALRSADTPQ